MKIGKYKIGRYHGIIKKIYTDESFDYETDFTSYDDILLSYYAIKKFIGQEVGKLTENPKTLQSVEIIRGKEDIKKELENL